MQQHEKVTRMKAEFAHKLKEAGLWGVSKVSEGRNAH